jgi:diguanylate cyclase (GGDEF)-like protein
MTEQPKINQSEPAGLGHENELLRASIADLRARLAEFEQRVDGDSVTGLPNRRRFLHELGRVLAICDRYFTPAALLQFEITNLDEIKRSHGELGSNAVLAETARRLSGLIRASDIAARAGDREFAILLDHLDQDSAIDAVERIARLVAAEPVDLGGGTARLQVCASMAAILPGDEVEEILQRAEINLARAREDGWGIFQ